MIANLAADSEVGRSVIAGRSVDAAVCCASTYDADAQEFGGKTAVLLAPPPAPSSGEVSRGGVPLLTHICRWVVRGFRQVEAGRSTHRSRRTVLRLHELKQHDPPTFAVGRTGGSSTNSKAHAHWEKKDFTSCSVAANPSGRHSSALPHPSTSDESHCIAVAEPVVNFHLAMQCLQTVALNEDSVSVMLKVRISVIFFSVIYIWHVCALSR